VNDGRTAREPAASVGPAQTRTATTPPGAVPERLGRRRRHRGCAACSAPWPLRAAVRDQRGLVRPSVPASGRRCPRSAVLDVRAGPLGW